MAISPIKASRCSSKYVFSLAPLPLALPKPPASDDVGLVFEGMLRRQSFGG
jgi:hypothetical protein